MFLLLHFVLTGITHEATFSWKLGCAERSKKASCIYLGLSGNFGWGCLVLLREAKFHMVSHPPVLLYTASLYRRIACPSLQYDNWVPRGSMLMSYVPKPITQPSAESGKGGTRMWILTGAVHQEPLTYHLTTNSLLNPRPTFSTATRYLFLNVTDILNLSSPVWLTPPHLKSLRSVYFISEISLLNQNLFFKLLSLIQAFIICPFSTNQYCQPHNKCNNGRYKSYIYRIKSLPKGIY